MNEGQSSWIWLQKQRAFLVQQYRALGQGLEIGTIDEHHTEFGGISLPHR